jgi:hypothetical protein
LSAALFLNMPVTFSLSLRRARLWQRLRPEQRQERRQPGQRQARLRPGQRLRRRQRQQPLRLLALQPLRLWQI